MNLTIVSTAVALGIKLSSRIIGFISEELSQKEKETQLQLKNSYKEYSESIMSADRQAELQIKHKIQNYEELTNIEIQRLKGQEKDKILLEIKGQILDLLISKSSERKNYVKNELISELKSSIARLRQISKENQNTAMRLNALKILEKELREILNRANAYVKYLDKYQKMIDKIYDNNISLDDDKQEMLFNFNLPEKWTYDGQLFYIMREDLNHSYGYGEFLIHNTIKLSFFIEDADIFSDNYRKVIPVFQKNYDNKNYRSVYSLTIGEYLDISRSGAYCGIPAIIDKYADRKTIIAKYNDSLELVLQTKYLMNFKHYPPPGADVIVYPLYERKHNNDWLFYVSQRPEDVQISLWFDKIPLILPLEKAAGFVDYWKENNLSDNCMDTKIAPYNSEFYKDINTVKIQFGEEYIILADIKSSEDAQRSFLEFNRFLDLSEKIIPDDIFAPFNAEIEIMLSSEIEKYTNDTTSDNMNNLVITLFKEFRRQYLLKTNEGGSRYYSSWEQVTSKLKDYLEIGDSVFCRPEGVPDKNNTELGIVLNYVVENRDELLAFYKSHNYIDNKHIGHHEYFTEFNGYRIPANIVNMKQHDLELLVPYSFLKNINIDELRLTTEIKIIKKEYAIPEQRQLFALHKYKVGALSNPELQAFLLNGKNIYSDRTEVGEIKLFNKSLNNDKSQYYALKTSLEENNFFMIQGPPGTGKTTVIRELLYQTLLRNNDARILIVSQANVAVDNVIKGLSGMGITLENVIRCGRSEKIQSEILDYSYEKKYKDYLRELENRCNGKGYIAELARRWLHSIDSKRIEPEIGELLLKSHNIIGATCIGLGQKQIGIDKIEFDLIVLDEAAKALAPELIIPIVKARKVIMIGDHKQLPAVINPLLFDEEKIEIDDKKYCKNVLFNQSLFERLFKSCPQSNKTTLSTQYRMPTVIGNLINQVFYDGLLENDLSTNNKRPIYFDNVLNLIDMSYESTYYENDSNGSPINIFESKYVISLIKQIRKKGYFGKIAIITPYKGQKYRIKNLCINDSDLKNDVQVCIDTIDSYQGDESEIVIFCTTRSKKKTRFFQDPKRLNVALSRAKNELIIIGSSKYMSSYDQKTPVYKILNYVKENGCIHPCSPIVVNDSIKQSYEIIEIRNIRISDYSVYDEEAIKKETLYYLKNNKFSCIPSVKKSDGFFIMLDHFEIYYAAIEIPLKDIQVEIINDYNNNFSPQNILKNLVNTNVISVFHNDQLKK